ncbi:LacI family DNA-binding transcriptional regulator [Ruegeria atlantica]|uniref:LacI family DNA-binding transcriptional regulator n=1 Tax=Ruegeria atlantica TaxID=81569 RepID=UPI00147FE05A|nr:LacI family DNA-binding transcriptional regulator [Ruegeria atlantica]
MSNRVTLKDIAREAGVHVSTVSRALDPNSNISLTNEVSSRVRKAAKKLGYRPNRLAAGLRTNRSMSIGVMIPDIANTMFPPIVRGIESVLEPLGYATIVVNTDNDPDREHRLTEVLRERGVDGIINVAAMRSDPGLSNVVDQGTPVVTLNRRLDQSPIPYVVSDEKSGINLILKHLFELGHRSVGHIAGPKEFSTGNARAMAYKEACEQLGLAESSTVISYAKSFDETEGQRCVLELLQNCPTITAIVCANDRLAFGAYLGLQAEGLSIPEDVSVTGFNDMPMLDLVRPKMTTIRVQKFEAGRASAELLLKSIRGDNHGAVGTVLPVELKVRDSTSEPRETPD